ncbi:MAG: polyphosphate kinase 1 [Deferribacterota bacterium]|nr:polyphosphate kinase 1 [Deferribacterota bacterium]
MNNKYPFINREISNILFNQRVLYESKDSNVPLFEKLKFIAIFSSNMDEFYMIRVAGLFDQLEAGYSKKDRSGMTPRQQLDNIKELASKLYKEQSDIFERLVAECKKHNIIFFPKIEGKLYDIAEAIFNDEIFPLISPITLSAANPFPFIYNQRLSIFIEMEKDGNIFYSLIIIPDNLKRVFKIKIGSYNYILAVEDIIERFLDRIFYGYNINNNYLFRITRDADLSVEEEGAEDLLKLIESELSKRKKGKVVRVEFDKEMPKNIRDFLRDKIVFQDAHIFTIKSKIDLTFLFDVHVENKKFYYPPFKPVLPKDIPLDNAIFDRIKKEDIILYRPYNNFYLITRLIELSACDDKVLSIKMTLYRANRDSNIMKNLIVAAEKGKQVSVVIELKARFDEEKNVEWAKRLEEAGCLVTYGFVNMKIHTKNLVIVRKENDRIVRYNHLSTGNYNEKTALQYTDIDYLTADEDVGYENAQLFNYLMGYTEYVSNKKRIVLAPRELRDKLLSLIDKEIYEAKCQRKGHIIVKVNSLIDKILIQKLYEASQSGVKIELIVRGICGIIPQIEGLSDNITVRSIVGRFLEHPRILYFYNGGDEKYYISTADWMERNMDHRVESLFEIIDDRAKNVLMKILQYNLRDNCKSWQLIKKEYVKNKPVDEAPFDHQDYLTKNPIL